MTASGIEPATFRFVAQHLNHCATAVPVPKCITADKQQDGRVVMCSGGPGSNPVQMLKGEHMEGCLFPKVYKGYGHTSRVLLRSRFIW